MSRIQRQTKVRIIREAAVEAEEVYTVGDVAMIDGILYLVSSLGPSGSLAVPAVKLALINMVSGSRYCGPLDIHCEELEGHGVTLLTLGVPAACTTQRIKSIEIRVLE